VAGTPLAWAKAARAVAELPAAAQAVVTASAYANERDLPVTDDYLDVLAHLTRASEMAPASA
jgi:hypothetical protein